MGRRASRIGWFRALVVLSLLTVLGFAAGLAAGFLWQEPGLIFAYWSGRTAEVAWGADPVPTADPAPAEEAAAVSAPGPALSGQGAAPGALPEVSAAPTRGASVRGASVQVGAFSERASAERLAESLRAKGHPVYVSPGAGAGDARWRVRVGPLASREEAERRAGRLKREEKLPTWVLDEGSG